MNVYNPLYIAGALRTMGRRRRGFRVGAEFSQCPDGTWVKGNPTAAKCGTVPVPIGDAARIPQGTPYTPPYTPPSGTGGGGMPGPIPTPYTPPSGTGGGGMPEPTPTPYTPPGGTPGCAPPAQVCPENQRRYIMPFNPDTGFTNTVAAGATTRFVGDPQALFLPDRLIIESTIAPYFDIIDLTIGNVPQSLSTGAVAAGIYSEVSTDMNFNFKQAYPGLKITITALNKSSITQTFQAQLAGWAVSQG